MLNQDDLCCSSSSVKERTVVDAVSSLVSGGYCILCVGWVYAFSCLVGLKDKIQGTAFSVNCKSNHPEHATHTMSHSNRNHWHLLT